ncbi:MAG: hypothetical protein L3J81_00535 [Thermoplasmata archaeon]|nr:hypothetical protein [Thermoplasmata archaeon]
MRIHKVVNRVYEGTTYYRWVLSVAPRDVRELGWVDGQDLEATVRGSVLSISPAFHRQPARHGRPASALEEGVQSKSVARR